MALIAKFTFSTRRDEHGNLVSVVTVRTWEDGVPKVRVRMSGAAAEVLEDTILDRVSLSQRWGTAA